MLLLAGGARHQQPVKLAPALRSDLGVDPRREQRVGERQAPAAHLQHTDGDRLVDRALEPLVAREVGDHGRAAIEKRGDDFEQAARVGRQRLQALCDELLQAHRNR